MEASLKTTDRQHSFLEAAVETLVGEWAASDSVDESAVSASDAPRGLARVTAKSSFLRDGRNEPTEHSEACSA